MDVGNNDSPNCYGPEYQNVTERSLIDYFETAILHDLQYPTYNWLKEAGITPSNETGVDVQEMIDILTEKSGAIPYVGILIGGRLDDTDT
jgi:ribonuclease T2